MRSADDPLPYAPAKRGYVSTPIMLLVALMCLVLIPAGPILFPSQGTPTRSDAIMVLGPADNGRLDFARSLVADGYSDTIIVSADANGGRLSRENIRICNEPRSFRVICKQPSPFTTQGEVALLQSVFDEREWQSVIVVTGTMHVARAQLYLDRCFDGQATVISDGTTPPLGSLPYQYLYQTAGFLKAFTATPGCA